MKILGKSRNLIFICKILRLLKSKTHRNQLKRSNTKIIWRANTKQRFKRMSNRRDWLRTLKKKKSKRIFNILREIYRYRDNSNKKEKIWQGLNWIEICNWKCSWHNNKEYKRLNKIKYFKKKCSNIQQSKNNVKITTSNILKILKWNMRKEWIIMLTM
jgi:hypothetical protein